MELGEQRRAQQFARGFIVALAQGASHLESGLAVASPCSLAHGEQGIGDLRHGADDDDGAIGDATLHNLGNAIDGFGVLHRGPAKFHDNHGRHTSHEQISEYEYISEHENAEHEDTPA
jgi:hypothetical protein